MILDPPLEDRSLTICQAHQLITQVLPQNQYPYTSPQEEHSPVSFDEIFEIFGKSLVQAFQHQLQLASVVLDLARYRQMALKTRRRVVQNDLIQSVIRVKEERVKYLETSSLSDELTSAHDQIVIEAMANIASRTLQIDQNPSATSVFAKFPKNVSPLRDKSLQSEGSGLGHSTQMSPTPSANSCIVTRCPRSTTREVKIEVADIHQTTYQAGEDPGNDTRESSVSLLADLTLPAYTPSVFHRARAKRDRYTGGFESMELPGRSRIENCNRHTPKRGGATTKDTKVKRQRSCRTKNLIARSIQFAASRFFLDMLSQSSNPIRK